MTSMSARRFFVVGLTVAWAGCYQDLDYSRIKCDITAENPCPDGLVCHKGLCTDPNALDAPVSDAGAAMEDVASFDQPPLDAATEPSDLATPQVDLGGAPDGGAPDEPGEVPLG
jgi:hypothetical protein